MMNDLSNKKIAIRHLTYIIDRILLTLSVLLLGLLVLNLVKYNILSFLIPYLYTFLWGAFLFEFSIKLYLAPYKWQYIVEEFFVVFIIIFPFLRPLRFFPASRWGLLIFAEEVNDTFPAFRKYRILEILLISLVLVVLSADLFLIVERTPDSLFKNFPDALWFSVVTVATVGYGDIFPKTPAGRILAVLLIIFGVSVFGIVTASISSYLVEKDTEKERKDERERMEKLAEDEHRIESRLVEMVAKEDLIERKIEELNQKIH